MRRLSRFVFVSSVSLLGAACVADLPAIDGDAGPSGDATAEGATLDAPSDANVDAPNDATPDVVTDAGSDSSSAVDASPTCLAAPPDLISLFTADDDALDHGPAASDLLWVGTPAFAHAEVGDGFNLSNVLALHRLTPLGLDGLQAITIEMWINPTQVLGANLVNRSA